MTSITNDDRPIEERLAEIPETGHPVRFCHGCTAYDDHPRFIDSTVLGNPAADMLYHFDCIPQDRLDHYGHNHDNHPGLQATRDGKRGHDVRLVMARHAWEQVEAPADEIQPGQQASAPSPAYLDKTPAEAPARVVATSPVVAPEVPASGTEEVSR